MSEDQKDKKKDAVGDVIEKTKALGLSVIGLVKQIDVTAIVNKVKGMIPKKAESAKEDEVKKDVEAKNDPVVEDDKKSKEG